MTEAVQTETLLNCTRLLLNKIQWTSFINSSEIENANRTEILELLSKLIEAEQTRDDSSEWSIRYMTLLCFQLLARNKNFT